jgi:signal transduction histidine kinase
MPATQRLAGIFIITILAPGLILGFFGLRALRQEKGLAGQQIRERLAAAAESIGRRLEFELREWRQTVDRIAQSGPANREAWPDRLRMAADAPGAAVVLYRDGQRIESLPPRQLLYDLYEAPDRSNASAPAPLIAQAEWLEWRDKKYDQAIAIYRRLLDAHKFGGRATVFHGLARNLKKAGHLEEAVQTFRRLEQEPPVRIGSLPSDLVALLRDGRVHDDTRRQQYYEMIVAETQRLRRLVENVLDFARMEDGRKQYRFEPVEPAGWLRAMAEDFQAEVAGAGFAVHAEIPDELPAIVADRETLKTAVHNLLDNAVKYSGGLQRRDIARQRRFRRSFDFSAR